MNLETLLDDSPCFLYLGKAPISAPPSRQVLEFLYKNVDETMTTLETGCGYTTVVFAMRQSVHYCIEPNLDVVERVKKYSNQRNIPLDKVNFIVERSEYVLPKLDESIQLDVAFIDGNHAFPFPYIDSFYTKMHLVVGGLMGIDDTQLKSCRILRDFLVSEPTWRYVCDIENTAFFRKIRDSDDIEDWTSQPFNTFPKYLQDISIKKRLTMLLKKGASKRLPSSAKFWIKKIIHKERDRE